jgi:hypothetical protein
MLSNICKLPFQILYRNYYQIVPNIYYKTYQNYRKEIKDENGNLIGYIWDIKKIDKMKYDELEKMMIKEVKIFVDI